MKDKYSDKLTYKVHVRLPVENRITPPKKLIQEIDIKIDIVESKEKTSLV